MSYQLPISADASNPPASATRYMGIVGGMSLATSALQTSFIMRHSGKIVAVDLFFLVAGTLASAGDVQVYLRKNDASDTTITLTGSMSSGGNTIINNGLSVDFSPGDEFEIKIVTPAWVTAPTTVYSHGSITVLN